MNEISGDWSTYRLTVVPLDAPNRQVVECRRAYFAGAGAIVRMLQHLLASSPSMPVVERELESLRAEIERFRADVRADRA